MEIIPSPGTEQKEWVTLEPRIELVKPFAKTIHIDVIDGKFAPNTTFLEPEPFAKHTKDIFFEVHLMVEEPIIYIEKWANAGFKRFIGQVEKMTDQHAFISFAKKHGEAALAIDGKTGIDALNVSLDKLDALLVMTIKAGFSGQKFNPENLEKVKIIKSKSNIPIEVDGGINDITILDAKNVGATRFVATSFIYKDDPKIQFEKLKSLLY